MDSSLHPCRSGFSRFVRSGSRALALVLLASPFTSCGLIRGISIGVDLAVPRFVAPRACASDVVIVDRRPVLRRRR